MAGVGGMFDLKDDKQAQEYLDRIGIEYRFQCYHEHLPDGCHRLADFLEAFRQDWSKARTVFATNCFDNRYGASCLKFGNYNLVGRGAIKDTVTAYNAFMQGCDYGHGPCCHNAALMNQSGLLRPDGEKNFVLAAELLQRGCSNGNVPSCQMLSTYYITGKPGLEKDMLKAFENAQKACDGGHIAACANLSRMYKLGDGVEQNKELAEKFKRKAHELHKSVTEMEVPLKFSE